MNLIFKTDLKSNLLTSITNILFWAIIIFPLEHGNILISFAFWFRVKTVARPLKIYFQNSSKSNSFKKDIRYKWLNWNFYLALNGTANLLLNQDYNLPPQCSYLTIYLVAEDWKLRVRLCVYVTNEHEHVFILCSHHCRLQSKLPLSVSCPTKMDS